MFLSSMLSFTALLSSCFCHLVPFACIISEQANHII
uniref:Uncharacterized protein n=1 Tax=Arundo donax TaxID=35708 RepID=A0A0A9BTX2_ARUDO